MDKPPDALATLVVAHDLPTAHIIRSRLDAFGIECFIPDEYFFSTAYNISVGMGIRIQVRAEDLEEAREVLAEDLSETPDDSPEAGEAGEEEAEENDDAAAEIEGGYWEWKSENWLHAFLGVMVVVVGAALLVALGALVTEIFK